VPISASLTTTRGWQAHTCFFTIDLPPYSSLAVMRERLLYAVTECRIIDTDFLPHERSDRGEGSSDGGSGSERDDDDDD
jgi:hypothetical protein